MKLRQNNILKRRNYSIKKTIVSSVVLVALMIILALAPAQYGADPSDTLVSMAPVSQTVDTGDSFTINITIDPGEPIAGVQVDILFDPTYITVESVSDGGMFDMWVGSELDIDNGAGLVDNIIAFDLGSVSSPGVFAIIECTAKMMPGTTTLVLDDVIVGNPEGVAVSLDLMGGSVIIVGEEPPDEDEFFSDVELVGFDSDSDGLMDAVEVLMDVDTTGGFVDVTVAGELEDPNMFIDDTSEVSWTIHGTDEDPESLYLYANGPAGNYTVFLVLIDESFNVEDNWSGIIYLYPPLHRPTTLVISPPSQSVEPGDTFTINLTIDPGVPIAGAQADIMFNPSLVQIDMVEAGDMFDEWLDTALEIDNINGSIRNIIAFDLDNVTTPGTFATITLTADGWNGITPLTIENALISNPDANPVSLLLSHGTVTITNGIEPDESFVDVELVGFDSDSDGLMDAVEVIMDVDTTGGFVDVTVAGELEDPNMFIDDTSEVSWTIHGTGEDPESLYLYATGPAGIYDVSLELYDDRMNLEDTWTGSIFLYSPLYGCYVNITPPSQFVYGNDIYCFNITVDPLEAIKGVECSLTFDPELITILDVQEGDFFNGYPHTFNTAYTLDNAQGRLSGIAGALLLPEDSITAPGTLAMICYQTSLIEDVSPLDLVNVIVCGSDGQPVQPFVTDGIVTILLHDTTPPEIENVQALPPCNHTGGYVNLSGMITDDVGLADISIHIIYPDLSETTFSLMNYHQGDTYYYNQTYAQPGTYTFIFEAADLEGNSISSPVHTFCITNLYPVADFTWHPLSICPNDTIFFDATSSYDLDGFITDYNWSYVPSGSSSPPTYMGTGDTLTYSWMAEGTYDVTLEVMDNLGDTGVLTQTIQVGYPTISVAISPVTQTVGNEETFQADIIVDPGQDTCAKIAGVQFTLNFDPTLLTALEITEGDFFEGLDSYFCDYTLGYAWCSINNTLGTITGVAGVTNTSGGYVATSGTFATITFQSGLLAGTSPLDLSNVIVGDKSGVSLPLSLGNGSVTIQDTLYPQISNVTASPPFQVTGGFVNLSGMVTDNMGLADVSLELIYPGFTVETVSILNNQSGSIYYCNRTYMQPGDYTFTLQASDTSGNSYTSPSYTYCIYPPLYVNITPSQQFVCENETFTVDVTIDTQGWNCVPLAGVQFNLLFDPDLLTVDNITEGDLFNGFLSLFTCPPYAPSWCTIDNSAGCIMNVSGVITTPGGFVTTSGTFATITFTAGSLAGTANLEFVDANVIVGDMYGHPLPLIINDGMVKIGIYTHKEIGDPVHGEYVTSNTEFELTGMTCSGEIEAVYYRIWDKETWDPHTGYWTPWTQYSAPFTLDHECTHYLEYYSIDTMGNTEVVNNQTHYVDNTPPISWKTVGEPHYDDQYCQCQWVTTSTPITLSAQDRGKCIVGQWRLYYRIWHDGSWSPWQTGDWNEDITLHFAEECKHYLEWYAMDILGNTESIHNQTHYVDDTPPSTTKTIGLPSYGDYVTTSTSITLAANDDGLCPVGSYKIYYKINDELFEGDWNEPVMFTFEEECEHVLEYWSVDILGNEEEHTIQTHYVDDTAPYTGKVIGKPEWGYFPISSGTSITIFENTTCQYVQTFPVADIITGGVMFNTSADEMYILSSTGHNLFIECYRPDREDIGNNIAGVRLNGVPGYPDGIWATVVIDYTLGSGGIVTSACYALGNDTATSTKLGNIYSTITLGFGSYITSQTPITLEPNDTLGSCVVGIGHTYYRIWYNGTWSDWYEYTGPFTLEEIDSNGGDCLHYLEWYSIDLLGNTESIHNQTHYVDDTGPVTTKTIGLPSYGDYVTTSTTITLEALDEGTCASGVKEIHYVINGVEHVAPGDMVTFTFMEECIHVLEFWAVDNLGNEGEHILQTHYVDDTGPVTTKTIGLPSYGDYVTTSTNITLEALDEGTCASGVKEIHYVINDVEYVAPGDMVTFTFMEECIHVLEFWAVDNLGNEGEHILQTHYVDDTPPVSWETIGDPHHITECCTWITTDTPITLSAVDLGTCAVGSWRIHWQIWLDETMIDYGTGDWNTPVTLYMDEECRHCIKWVTEDDLGNTELVYNTQIYYVDDTPPSTNMDYGEPKYVSDDDVYISPVTPIYLNVSDGGLCPVNCFTIYYRIWNQSMGWSEWQSGTTNISLFVGDNCMHYIEYYAVDCLGNNESGVEWAGLHNHTFFVDTTAPVTLKEIGAPNYQDDYWVTPDTMVWLNSSDTGDHIVPVECLHYEIWWDSNTDGIVDTLMDSVTICDNTANDSDSTVGSISVNFTFEEECLHEIRWYAWDILGNIEQEQQQEHRVDTQSPILSIDIDGPYHIDDVTSDQYLSSAATLTLTATDPNEPCASGIQSILYQIEYDGVIHPVSPDDYYCTNQNITDHNGAYWYIYYDDSVNFDVICFHENCTHILTVKVIDNVDQSSLFTYTYHVDNIPTMTTLEIGDPRYDDFVTTTTPIWLNTTDMGDCAVGCKFLHWEVQWWNETSGQWEWRKSCCESDNNAEFTFDEECLHKVIWWSGDYLGNNESTHEMIFKVDDTPPIIEKIVGQPQYTGNLPPGEYYINQSTPLWITATDTGMGECIVGSVHLNVSVTYLGEKTWYSPEVEVKTGTASIEPLYLSEGEGMYYVNVTAKDNLGNVAYDNETFIVDNTPPVLNKTVGNPHYTGDLPPGDYYINTSTPIWLETLDMSGTKGIYYRIEFNGTWYPRNMTDSYCGNSNITEIHGTYWYVYSNESVAFCPILFHEECIHTLTVMTQDNLGQYILHTETFSVDVTPPVTTKIIGDPSYDTDNDTIPEYVTTSTPILFTATDISGVKGTYYRISYDDIWHPVGMNDSYCGNINITEIDGTYWYVYYNQSVNFGPILFHEECIHHLQFFSIDNLGQKEDITFQTHYVDDTAPISFKHIGKPQYDTECCGNWVTTHTPITLSAIEIGDCKVDIWQIHWEIQQNGFTIDSGTGDWNNPVVLYFTEECNHTIIWWAEDKLGNNESSPNWENVHTQSHYVDDTPPLTTKTIGTPSYWGNYWLTTNTTICLNAIDQGECILGVDFIHYEIWWDSDNDSIVDTKIADENIQDDSVCFTLPHEGFYTLNWYSVDLLGNQEETHSQEHKVDNTPPTLNKDIGEPKYDYDPPHDYYITGQTPIWINMSDALTNATLHYCIYYNDTWHNYTSPVNVTFTLAEFNWSDECHHILRVWAIDDLGNRFDLPDENLYRDDTPPVSEKFFCCDPIYINGSDEWITSQTYVVIEAEDTGICTSGVKEIWYTISLWNQTQESWMVIQNDTKYCGPFRIFEECKHKVTWWTYDNLMNQETIQENIFHVDNTPPQSMKHFDGPFYMANNGTEEYIHANDTQIILTATDYPLGPCASGVKEIWYQIWIWNDEEWMLEQDNTLYTGPFTITEICKHKLVWWAIDNLDNREADNTNVFYVDGTPPLSEKSIGTPSYDTDGDTIHEYVKTGTPIWINITDPGYCAAGVNYTLVKIWRDITGDGVVDVLLNPPGGDIIYDGDSYTGDYVTGDLDGIKNGYISLKIVFQEECYHMIEWYSVDYVKNNETPQTQIHYVDDTAPETLKEIGQPHYGDFVTTQTPIWLNTTDPGQCAVGVDYIHWEIYQWDEALSEWVWRKGCCGSSGEPSNTARIYFDEECTHKIVWWGVDHLGNTENATEQIHYVDDTPPITTKTIIGGYHDGITQNGTIIVLNATDYGCNNGVGTMSLHYEIWWDSDNDSVVDLCKISATILDDSIDDLDSVFGKILCSYTFNQTGYHEIWWYSTDYLGNQETAHIQSHYVDDTPSITTKEIGQPKYPEEGPFMGDYVTTHTPIWLNATTPGDPEGANVSMTHIWVWWDSDNNGTVDYLLDNATIIDGVTYSNGTHILGDLDGMVNGKISVQIQFLEECYHEIWWYSVDLVGNTETLHKQGHHVDDTAPTTTLTIGAPSVGDFVTAMTPLYLNTTDLGECVVGCDYIHWEVYWWNSTTEEWVLENYGDDYDNQAEIYFSRECKHRLEWWSVDFLGNMEEEQEHIFYVDDTPPEIIKAVGLPQYTEGLPLGDYYVTNATPLWVNVTDMGLDPCIVGSLNLTITIHHQAVTSAVSAGAENGTLSIGPFYLEPDGIHYVNITVWDNLGNTNSDHEIFYVDSQAPLTQKTVGEPQYDNSNWTTSHTPIYLNTTDQGEYPVGCDYLHWEIWWWNESSGAWKLLESGIDYGNQAELFFDEECTHKIIWWAVDFLGNEEAVHEQIHYVDDTPPTTTKDIMGPVYMDYVSLETILVLNATDDGCLGGIGVSHLHYEVWWDSDNDSVVDTQVDNVTIYDNGTGDLNPAVGEIIANYQFSQECYHEIWWYSVDYATNQEIMHVQSHQVDNTPPQSHKEMCCGGFYIDDAENEWINHDTHIVLEAGDPGVCASGVNEIWYQIWLWNDTTGWNQIQNDTLYNCSFTIQEDCYHKLVWWAIDWVNNTEDIHTNEFYVEGNPPIITKSIGPPHYLGDLPHEYYVTNTTPIYINATDNTTGACIVGSVNLTVTVEYLGAQTQYHTTQVMSGLATLGPLYLEGDCIHYVNVTARDNIGNTAYANYTFYVDITPPLSEKTIISPSYDNGNWTSAPATIWINVTDPGICAVGICHTVIEVWYDNNSDDIVDTLLDSATICDGACTHDGTHITGDLDETVNGKINITVLFKEECYHEIHWYSVDCFGNTETLHNQSHHADATPPVTTNSIPDGSTVTNETLFYLNATDNGDCAVGIDFIHYEIWWNQSQIYTENTSLDTVNFTLGDYGITIGDCEIYWYSVDLLGNTEIEHTNSYTVIESSP